MAASKEHFHAPAQIEMGKFQEHYSPLAAHLARLVSTTAVHDELFRSHHSREQEAHLQYTLENTLKCRSCFLMALRRIT